MRDPTSDLIRSYDLSTKVGQVLQRRLELAQERFNDRIQPAYRKYLEELWIRPISPWELFASWQEYATDLAQRCILRELERWWGGFCLLNREEIEWIAENLFVGKRLWSGGMRAQGRKLLDLRELHPLGFGRRALLDENPWVWWLAPAEAAKAQRQPADSGQPVRQLEWMMSELASGSLDLFRDVRDALSEALFFQVCGDLFFLTPMDAGEKAGEEGSPKTPDPRTLPFVREALASVAEGGFADALARVGALLARRGTPIPLARLELEETLIGDYRDLLPDLSGDAMRRIRAEQEIIVQYEPERALETLPQLLREPGDRDRLRTLLERLLADPRLPRGDVNPAQEERIGRIRALLGGHTATKTKLRNGLRL
ncbi:MAG: DUF3141 domain-containing protein [Chromatiaceae bacterium]